MDDHQSLHRIVYFKFSVNVFRIVAQAFALLKELRAAKIDLVVNFETFNNASAVFSYLTKAPVRVGLNNRHEKRFYTHYINRDYQAHITEVFSDLLRVLDIKFCYAYHSFPVKEHARQTVQQIVKDQSYICFHPGTSVNFSGRRSREEYFVNLANLCIQKFGLPVYFTGADKEQLIIARIMEKVCDKSKAVDVSGRFTIAELIEFLRGCKLFVANDTGPVHLAASLKVNTVVMFGPNLPQRYRPLNQNSLVFYKGSACSPCMGAEFLTQACRNQYQCLDFDPQETFAQISKKFFE
ncbi:MAG: glycosyltransferase family 9 protein [Candidatus Omnitrophica bacterium]|nr:glycosyltransferase family 9 protein [Candidatus Omnitrophota bacterium]